MQKRNTTLVTRQFADPARMTRLVGLFILTTLALAPCGIRA